MHPTGHRLAQHAVVMCLSIFVPTVCAHSTYNRLIPNGDNVPGWRAVGHVEPLPPRGNLTGFHRNRFGLDFKQARFQWTVELCHMDSDGDGATNGEELGDPLCVWHVGMRPSRSSNITHPGFSPAEMSLLTPREIARRHKAARKYAVDVLGSASDVVYKRPYRDGYGNIFVPYIAEPFFIVLAYALSRTVKGIPEVRWWVILAMTWYIGGVGAGIGLHRYFSHRAFKTGFIGKTFLMFTATAAMEGDPIEWAYMHRVHHRLCDQELDFHSPIASNRGFLHAHMLWYVTTKKHLPRAIHMPGIMADLKEDPEMWLALKLTPANVPVFVLAIFAVIAWFALPRKEGEHRNAQRRRLARAHAHVTGITDSVPKVARRGADGEVDVDDFVDGIAPSLHGWSRLRLWLAFTFFYFGVYYAWPCLITWHGTMLVNSATHMWGEMPFEDGMGSQECHAVNVPWLQFWLIGENWHNNHHAAPGSASTWVSWYQFDGVYVTIRFLEAIGLAWDVRIETPTPRVGYAFDPEELMTTELVQMISAQALVLGIMIAACVWLPCCANQRKRQRRQATIEAQLLMANFHRGQ